MCESCRQVEAEVLSKSKNKIHQTWGPPISGALYNEAEKDLLGCEIGSKQLRNLPGLCPAVA